MSFSILIGYLILFLLYQVAEANGQDLLHLPWKPYSIFVLFLLVIGAAEGVARWQSAEGLAAYGMGLRAGWWQDYLIGLALGVVVQGGMEAVGVRAGVRRVEGIQFSPLALAGSVAWILFANFPAAAAEDLITRGYPFRFIQDSPLAVFMLFSASLYVVNHIIRLVTKPMTDWIHLPIAGLTLAYALAQTGSLWLVIGLHQSGNVIYYCMRQLMAVATTDDRGKRIRFNIASETVFLIAVVLFIH